MKQPNPKVMRRAADNAATCSLVATLLVLPAIGLISYQTTQQFLRNGQRVAHTYQVIGALDAVQIDLESAETGQRGFLLTGDSSYLTPYESGSRFATADLETIRALTLDNPLQQRRVNRLQAISAAKLAELDQTIALRRQVGSAAALAVVKSGRGKAQMDAARQTAAQMKQEELRLLAERDREARAAGAVARGWVGFGTLFGMLLITVAILFVGRYLRQRERAEEDNIHLLEDTRDAAVSQRNFVKDVLASVTEGRLSLCDTAEDLPPPLTEIGPPILLSESSGLRALRHAAIAAARTCGFAEERVQDLATSVSEAGMNAITHGRGGTAHIRSNKQDLVQVWITDNGTGIMLSSLPQATLERGYSSAGTLGHGFWLMLKMVDRLFLLTGPLGTTIILEQGPHSQEASWMQHEVKPSGLSFRTAGESESGKSQPGASDLF